MTEVLYSRLNACDCEHCQSLLQYLLDDGTTISHLSYEDVFTPLRHHSVALYVKGTGYVIQSDLCYRVKDQVRNFSTAIDPFSIWNALDIHDERGEVYFEVNE